MIFGFQYMISSILFMYCREGEAVGHLQGVVVPVVVEVAWCHHSTPQPKSCLRLLTPRLPKSSPHSHQYHPKRNTCLYPRHRMIRLPPKILVMTLNSHQIIHRKMNSQNVPRRYDSYTLLFRFASSECCILQ